MSTAIAVRDTGILFSGPMVRAILDGTKTQTRRVMLPQPTGEARSLAEWSRRIAATCGEHSPDAEKSAAHVERLRGRVFPFANAEGRLSSPVCPFGHPGDRLWVRETWAAPFRRPGASDPEFCYRADLAPGQVYLGVDRWRPSIHMPRRASRITLELTGVRVERVQDISEDDAVDEGCEGDWILRRDGEGDWTGTKITARDQYRALWDSLNAKRGYGWDANPWVWVLEFRRLAT